MKTSEVFKLAKQQLATTYGETGYYNRAGKEQFICVAIHTASAHTKRITDEDIERCIDIVEARLGGSHTLESWLVDKGCLPCNGWTTADRDRAQQHRHAWLDMLIAEFEAQGD